MGTVALCHSAHRGSKSNKGNISTLRDRSTVTRGHRDAEAIRHRDVRGTKLEKMFLRLRSLATHGWSQRKSHSGVRPPYVPVSCQIRGRLQ